MGDQIVDRPPAVQQWLDGLGIPPIPPGFDWSTELVLVAKRPETPLMPENVLRAWHAHMASARRAAEQSEQEFIRQSRRAGWSWDRIAVALALPTGAEAEDRPQVLTERMRRTHPQVDSRPWTGTSEGDCPIVDPPVEGSARD